MILLFASGAVFGGWDWYFVAAMAAFFLILFVVISYFRIEGQV